MNPETVRAAKQHLQKRTPEVINTLVGVGFCQPKFYRPEVWRKAKKIMEIACSLGLAEPFDFGRGCGKYTTALTIQEVRQTLLEIRGGAVYAE